MTTSAALPSLLANLPLLVALGAAVAVSVFRVTHRPDVTGGLALSGFAGLLVTYAMASLTPAAAGWLAYVRPERNLEPILGAFTLAGSTVAALAVACLVGAVWLGRQRRARW